MAKFKRFDPRNKKAHKEKYFSSKENRRDKLTHHAIVSPIQTKRKHTDEDFYTYTTEEFDL